jgi:hypothetical protein
MRPGPLPEMLDGLHNLALLGEKSISQRLHPLKPVIHHCED